jgi:hypothetical protein
MCSWFAYRAHVFMDFQSWKMMNMLLATGARYPQWAWHSGIQALHWEMPLRPLLQPWREIANSVYLNYLLELRPRAMQKKSRLPS